MKGEVLLVDEDDDEDEDEDEDDGATEDGRAMETRWFSPFDGSLVSLRLHPQNSGRRTTQDELSREVYGFGGPLCPDDRLKSLVEKETYFTMMLQSLPSEFSGPYILQAPWLSLACFSSIFLQLCFILGL